jgi:hypothetical protein
MLVQQWPPALKRAMKPESRDALLTAIVKARGWIDDIRLGRTTHCVTGFCSGHEA